MVFATSWKVWILSLQQHTGVWEHDDSVLILRLGQLCQLNHRKHNLKYQMAQVNCGIETARKIGQSDALCACLWSQLQTFVSLWLKLWLTGLNLHLCVFIKVIKCFWWVARIQVESERFETGWYAISCTESSEYLISSKWRHTERLSAHYSISLAFALLL